MVGGVVGVVSQESRVVPVLPRWPLESCSCYCVGQTTRLTSLQPCHAITRQPEGVSASANAGVPAAACLLVAGGFMVIYWGFFISPWSAINIFIPPE